MDEWVDEQMMTSFSQGIPVDYIVITTIIEREGEALETVSESYMNS